MTRRVTVLVGTDHHDFSRLVGWADDWQQQHPDDEVLVQHGFSPPPRAAGGVELVPPSELVSLLAASDVVVTHGGPGTIMSARHAGHHPVAVPRDPTLGEHVDGHQVRFVSWAAGNGLCDEARSLDDLSRRVVALGANGTRSVAAQDPGHAVDPAVLDEVALRRRPRRAPSPAALRVIYSADAGPDPTLLSPRPPAALLRLGQVSDLWLGDADAGCTCGCDRRTCPFWADVVGRAFGGWDDGRLAGLRASHVAARSRVAAAVRRHPGGRNRRLFLAVADGYRRTCRAALATSGAAVVADEGGPLVDALVLSHCRELDLHVVAPEPHGAGTGRLLVTALRYRGVPVAPAAPESTDRSLRAGADDHRLLPSAATGQRGSIAR